MKNRRIFVGAKIKKQTITTMKVKIFYAIMLMALCVSLTASAQVEEDDLDYKPYPYMFIGLQGGMQTTLTNYPQADIITGTASASFGAMFSRAFGARFHVNGAWCKGGLAQPERDYRYDYNYVTANIDLMVNVLGFISSLKNFPLSTNIIAGIGLNTAWNNDDAGYINNSLGKTLLTDAWTGTKFSHNLRVGLMLDYRINKHWSMNIEADANSLHDRFNSKRSDCDDWQITAQVGVAYRFGYKKRTYTEPVVVPYVEEFDENRDADVVTDAPVVQPTKYEQMQKDIFFKIGKTEVDDDELSKIEDVIAWMKSHPTATASVTGHADAGTGTAEKNAVYARGRAENVAKAIIDGGIDASRLKVDSKGDTVMPYGDNEKSRVAIIVAEEK